MKQAIGIFLTGILLGLTQVTILPNGFEFPPAFFAHLAWIALVPLLLVVSAKSFRRIFAISFGSFFVFYTFALYWLTIAMAVYGGIAWAASITLLFLVIGIITFFTTAGFAMAFAIHRQFRVPLEITLPTGWAAMEYVRTHAFSGFPWANLADSQPFANLPLTQVSEITGEQGVVWILVFGNVVLFRLIRQEISVKRGLIYTGLLFCLIAFGWMRLRHWEAPATEHVRISALQANISQSEKWEPRFAESAILEHTALAKRAMEDNAQLVVWPEASFPYLLERDLVRFPTPMPLGVPQIIGAPSHRGSQLYNTAFLVLPNQDVEEAYDKTHLVPFGEYVPFKHLLFFVDKLVPAVGDFDTGTEPRVLHLPGESSAKLPFGVLICYEDVFPAVARDLTRQGAQFLINITNDAWYGVSSAAKQHLGISIYRAIENRRALLRATNTGLTALILPSGRVSQAIPWFTKNLLTVDLPLYQGSGTFFRWAGDWFSQLCLVITLAFFSGAFVLHRRIGYRWIGLTRERIE